MSLVAGGANVLLGLVYFQYGTMTILEMRRNWSTMGFSHFGAAWIAMAFTCGPHHFVHGIHMLLEGRGAVPADVVTTLVALPAGTIWFALRVEAFRGGSGDRFIAGNPVWVMALPTLGGAYVGALITAAIATGIEVQPERLPVVALSAALVWLYLVVAFYVGRTQVANRAPLGGWSASGLALATIFVTCSTMHAVYGLAVVSGSYDADWHGWLIDGIGVPAAIYFVFVVRALYRGTFRDWNRVGSALRAAADRVVPEAAPNVADPTG